MVSYTLKRSASCLEALESSATAALSFPLVIPISSLLLLGESFGVLALSPDLLVFLVLFAEIDSDVWCFYHDHHRPFHLLCLLDDQSGSLSLEDSFCSFPCLLYN